MPEKIIKSIGKRKTSVARATIKKGNGRIKINSRPLDLITPKYKRMTIRESVLIAGDVADKVDINVNVKGGGIWGQASAARTAIANGILEWTGDKSLQDKYMDYDRSLLVSDSRRTEPHKPSRSSKGPRRKKQQSKR